MPINDKVIAQIVERCDQDEDVMDILERGLKTFQQYHEAIYRMETHRLLHPRDEKSAFEELDKSRTINHDAVINYLRIINKLAYDYKLPPFYEGVVSEEAPYRRVIANSVLRYVETIIENRL